MSTTSATTSISTVAAKPKVICVTTDNRKITVDVEIMRHSHTFDAMYRNSGKDKKNEDFPCEFPVEADARTFLKIVVWCAKHKDQPDPAIETREDGRRKWFHFDNFEKKFLLDVPVEEVSQLVVLAKTLDIRTLYIYGTQTIANFVHKAVKSRNQGRILNAMLALGADESIFKQLPQPAA